MSPFLACLSLAPIAHADRPRHGFSPGHVASVAVELATGDALPGAIVPGTVVPVTITVTDDRGRTLSTADRSLRRDSKHVELAFEGGRYDASTGRFVALRPTGEAARTAAVTVRVGYRNRPDLVRTETRAIDWRAVLGPDPEEIRSLNVSAASDGLLDGWLLPGATLALTATVTDPWGRTYSTAKGSDLRLPWDRLGVEVQGLSPQGEGRFLAAESAVPSGRYTAVVRATGAPHRADGSWRADFERRDGPDPKNVASLAWSLATPADSPAGAAPLGSTLPLEVSVTTRDGRVFALHGDGPLRLPASRLVVTTKAAVWDPAAGTVTLADTVSPGETHAIELRYAGRKDLGGRLTVRPDYLGTVPEWMAPAAEDGRGHVLAGEPGAQGREGRRGREGRDGADAEDVDDTAATGERGGEGAVGEDGQPGQPGPHVQIYATATWTPDRAERVVVYRLVSETGASEVRVKRWEQAPVIVESRGGPGGSGGDGGDGGDGGNGGSGCRSGDGGDGGRGGDAGHGADGGAGGFVELIASSPELYRHFELRTLGGEGGAAGDGGGAGSGGRSPALVSLVGSLASLAATVSADGPVDTPDCRAGSPGSSGTPGRAGAAGHGGPGGKVAKRVADEVAAQVGALPPALQAVLVAP